MGHLLLTVSARSVVVVGLLLMVLTIAFGIIKKRVSSGKWDRGVKVWCAALGLLVGSFLVTGLTGMWDHHNQVFYAPAVVAVIGLVSLIQPVMLARPAIFLGGLAVLAVGLSGVTSPATYAKAVRSFPWSLAQIGEVSPEAAAILSTGVPRTYARIGQNDDRGHAYGLRDWKLACPRFYQYPFDDPQVLQEVSDCLPSADVIVVSPNAIAKPGDGSATWSAYLEYVRRTLDDHYSCRPFQAVTICVRR